MKGGRTAAEPSGKASAVSGVPLVETEVVAYWPPGATANIGSRLQYMDPYEPQDNICG